jgi:hypothetical protein
MKTKILFPNQFKWVGWIILIPSAILGVLLLFSEFSFNFLESIKVFAIYSDDFWGDDRIFGFIHDDLSNEVLGILCIAGAILVAFSKEKHEDEFIAKMRMESLVWAIYINYGVLIFCMVFFYGEAFYYVMIFNMFTILIIFICRFYYNLYRSNKSLNYEK